MNATLSISVPAAALLFGSMAVISISAQKPHARQTPEPTFAKDIAPIFQKSCAGCHSSTAHKGRLVLDSYETLMQGGRHGQEIAAHDPDNSRLLQMIEGKLDPRMPLESDPLSAAEIAKIRAWIKIGAAGPAPGTSLASTLPTLLPSITPQVPAISPIASLRFSPDGSVLAVGGYQQVRLVDTGTGRTVVTFPGEADVVRSIAFSPDGKRIAAAGGEPQRSGEIKIWDVTSQRLLVTLKGHKDCIYSIAWSPDGKLIASASYDKMIKLWDPETGNEVRNLQDHIDAVFAVAFSPDGRHLASASQDRTVKIWDVSSGKRLYTLSDASDGLTSLAFAPSGKQLAAAGYDKTIYVWQVGDEDGHLLRSLIADEDSQLSLLWSRDGSSIITASADGSIRFRDPQLDLKGVVTGQPDWVEALDIDPSGKWVAAGRYNGSLSLYDSSTYKESRALSVFETSQTTSAEAASR